MKKIILLALLSLAACGVQTFNVGDDSAALEVDAGDTDANAELHLGVAITGQSNAVAAAKIADITDPTVRAEMDTAYAPVTLTSNLGANKSDPIVWTEYATASLAPRPDFHHHFGAELTLGRALDVEFEEPVDLIKFAGNGMGLVAHRGPLANYPTLPTGTDTFNDQLLEYAADTSASVGADVRVLVEMGGEFDGKKLAHANAYDEHASQQRDELEIIIGHDVAHVVILLNDDQGAAFNAEVRASQANYAATADCVGLVNADDLPLRDTDHYTADAYLELGYRISAAIVALAGAGCL